jgi:PAS domain S-box-containing protein
MSLENFTQQVSVMHGRISTLFNQVGNGSIATAKLETSAIKELGFAMEELQVALEEMKQQNQKLVEARDRAEAERRRYQNLFYYAPEAYLITTLEGEIREANLRASELLGRSVQGLLGARVDTLLAAESDRPPFEQELLRRQERDYFQEWELRFKPAYGNPFDAACVVVADRDGDGKPERYQWTVRDISERKRRAFLEKVGDRESTSLTTLLQNHPVEWFCRGDIIPLHPQSIWYIKQGLVKLTHLSEQNKEVLLGLIGSGMPFGAYLTSLPLYEATALTDVKLIPISIAEMATSCPLAQHLLAKTSQRLRQTEALLAISGERQLETRLVRLLELLKDEVGEAVAQGVRLNLRLTHEDLASACCTTRVTISQLLSKLQQQRKIVYGPGKHLILTQTFNP